MKKQLTTDAEIWQCVLAGKTIHEVSDQDTYRRREIKLVNKNAYYYGDTELPADIARQVRKYYEVTE